ncbi:MAG: hypothetical protein ACPGVF_06755 [Flavobacteriaceae bacterium]
MIKAVLNVFNYRIYLILIETFVVIQFYKYFSIKLEIDLTILSIAIVFPLVFSITSAYQRRQDAVVHFTSFRNKIIDLTNLIYSVNNIEKKQYVKIFDMLLSLQSILNFRLQESNVADNALADIRRLRKNIFKEIMAYKDKFNEREKDSIIRVKNEMFYDIEMLNGIKIHTTPISLRMYCLIFIYLSPLLFNANDFLFTNQNQSSDILSMIISMMISFILMALYNVQDYIENPFDQKGLDDLKISDLIVKEGENLFTKEN